jgi:tetratricopeptide (TPR) repeat protein
MKRTIFVLLFVAFFIGMLVSAQEDAYQSGDYQGAILAYEQRLANGEASGEIYYNLGLSYYETGQLGLALLNYRKAEIYLPRDEAVALQIARIRGQREDFIGSETDWLAITANMTGDVLTLYELSIVVFALWALYFLLLALSRASLRWLLWLTAAGMLIGVFFLGVRLYVETQQAEAVILVDAAQVMSGPAGDYLPLYVLYEAAELRIVEERDGWLRFMLADGRSGWIAVEDVGTVNVGES